MVKRFEVYLVNLDPQPSKDAKNTRPAVVISPDEMNANLENVIIAPLSSTNLKYPTRVSTQFLNSERSVVLDQIRSVDSIRLVKKSARSTRLRKKKHYPDCRSCLRNNRMSSDSSSEMRKERENSISLVLSFSPGLKSTY